MTPTDWDRVGDLFWFAAYAFAVVYLAAKGLECLETWRLHRRQLRGDRQGQHVRREVARFLVRPDLDVRFKRGVIYDNGCTCDQDEPITPHASVFPEHAGLVVTMHQQERPR